MSQILTISLWVAQVFIALSFCWGGYMKMFFPIPKLVAMWPWTGDLRVAYVRGLGVIDCAGGIGVLLPAIIGIMPGLIVPAALGCVVLQICAIVFHISRREFSALPVNIIFILASAFIFWGRWMLIPV